MAWSFLGTKRPEFGWVEFELPALGNTLLRVTQTYDPAEVSYLNKVYLGEFYANGGFRFLRQIYPNDLPLLFDFVVPPVFADAGYTVRHFAIRHNRYGVVDSANWLITLEEWLPDGEPSQYIDGGTYAGF